MRPSLVILTTTVKRGKGSVNLCVQAAPYWKDQELTPARSCRNNPEKTKTLEEERENIQIFQGLNPWKTSFHKHVNRFQASNHRP